MYSNYEYTRMEFPCSSYMCTRNTMRYYNPCVLQGDTLAPLLFIITLDYVLRTSIDLHKDLGLKLQKSRGRRYPTVTISDADYADDLALFADSCSDAEKLLHGLEDKANSVGLRVNIRKIQNCNINTDHKVRSVNGSQLKSVDNYTYLGSEISSVDKEIKIRIVKSWSALDKLSSIWKSNLTATLKRNFFNKLERKLDGTYTRMLRVVFNISWKLHLTNKKLYGNIPTTSKTIRERRTRFARHCFRSVNEIISGVIMWMPAHGFTKRGRPKRNYIKKLTGDTGLTVEEAKKAMKDRNIWKNIVEYARETIPIW